jgi:DNA-directed RNA polymerase I subunit RPA2
LCRRSDYEVGEELLRKYVFIHLSEPADKLQLMLAMLHKLYALVSEACCIVQTASVALQG